MIFPLVTLLDLSASSERNENIKNNKISEEMKENLNDNEGSDHVDGRLRELGARPKTVNTSLTMDIRWEMSCSQWTFFHGEMFRKKISDWYEEAEAEVERDLSLDISQLENKKSCKEFAQRRDIYHRN